MRRGIGAKCKDDLLQPAEEALLVDAGGMAGRIDLTEKLCGSGLARNRRSPASWLGACRHP